MIIGAQEAGRLFCPQCGNATMEKVEVTTGPDGAEQYGIRKKHNLRGTRYSLPKPKVRGIMSLDHCSLAFECRVQVYVHCVSAAVTDRCKMCCCLARRCCCGCCSAAGVCC